MFGLKKEEPEYSYLFVTEVTFFYRIAGVERSSQRCFSTKLKELPTNETLLELRKCFAISPLVTFSGLSKKYVAFAKNWAIIALDELIDELELPPTERLKLNRLMAVNLIDKGPYQKLSSYSFKYEYRPDRKPSGNNHTAIVEFSICKC